MTTSKFLALLRNWFSASRRSAVPQERRLRLTQLEDRRVLNGTLGLTGIVLTGGETLTVADAGFVRVGPGGADEVQTVSFELSAGTWTVDAAIDTDLYDISGGDLLTIDARLLTDGFEYEGAPVDVVGPGSVLQILGSAEETDTLIIDLTPDNESPPSFDLIPAGGISFAGGESTDVPDNDTLEITGYDLDGLAANRLVVTHTGVVDGITPTDSGTIVVGQLGSVSFDELEPILLSGDATNMIINLPAGLDPTVVLSDDGTANDNVSQIDGLFELTTFTNPTGSLTINDGTGDKTISVMGLDAMFSADLAIQEDDGTLDNIVSFDAATSTGGGDLFVESHQVLIPSAISTTSGGGDGDATILCDLDLDIDADITLGTGSLLLDVEGNVTQQAGDIITADGLALVVDGTTTLTDPGNAVSRFAANNGDATDFANSIDLTIDEIMVGATTVTGITTQSALVRIDDAAAIDIQHSIVSNGGLVDLDAGTSVSSGAGGTITTTSNVADGASGVVDIDAGTFANLQGAISTPGAATNGDGGNVFIDTAAGSIAVAAIAASGSGSGAGGNVQLTAIGLNSDVAINGAVSTNGTAAISVTAPDAVTFSTAGSLSANGTGAVLVTANSDALAGDSGDGITMDGNSFINAGTGTTASGTVTLLSTGANGGSIQAQTMTSRNAQIRIDSGAGVSLLDAITSNGGLVDIDAVTTISSGTDGDITTTGFAAGDASGQVSIQAGTLANSDISLQGDIVTLGAGAGSSGGTVTVIAPEGDVTVAGIDVRAGSGGTSGIIQVDANGTTSDVVVTGPLQTSGGSIGITADDSVALRTAAVITSAGGVVLVQSNVNGVAGNGNAAPAVAANSVLMEDGSSIDAGAATITIRSNGVAGGSIVAENLTTTNTTITVRALTGVFLNGAISSSGGLVDIDSEGAGVSSNAQGTITTTSNIADGASGAVDIDAFSSVNLLGAISTLGAVTNGAGGDVSISVAAGSLAVSALNASGSGSGAGGTVQLTAVGQNSDVAINGAVATNGAAAITVTADDVITFSTNGSLSANGTGAVLVRSNADADATAGDSGNGITMNGNSFINAGTGTTASGTVTLQSTGLNGGAIQAQGLSTVNATILVDSATSVSVQGAVNSRGGLVDINAVTSVSSDSTGTITTTSSVADAASGDVDIDAGTFVNLQGAISTSGAATNGVGGNVSIDAAAGSLTAAAIAASGSGSGDGGIVQLIALGQNSDVAINGAVSTNGTALISVFADDAVTFSTNGSLSSNGTGAVVVRSNADADATAGNSGNGITMNGNSFISAGTGTTPSAPVLLVSTGLNGGSIQAQDLSTVNATIFVNSGAGVLLQGALHSHGGLVDINAVTSVSSTGTGTITTTSGVADGASGVVDIDAGTFVNLQGAISTVGAATNGAAGNVSIDAAAGGVTVAAIAASGSGSGAGGNVQLTALGQNSDVAVNGAISTNGTGTVTVTAPDAVTFSGSGSIAANGTGAVQVTANSDALAGNSGDGITMASGAFINAGTGITPSGTVILTSTGANGGPIQAQAITSRNALIWINSGDSVSLQGAVNSNGGFVTVFAVTSVSGTAAGTITTTSNVADGSSAQVTIDAVTGVNLAGAVSTAGAATNGAGDHVVIQATAGNVTVGAISASGSGTGNGGSISLTAAGQNSDVTLNGAVTTNGTGVVQVIAHDAVVLNGTSSISADGSGFVFVNSNNVTTDGDSGDGITMASGSFISAGTGTTTSGSISLTSTGLNGGPIQAQALSTVNATIFVNSGDSVALQGAVNSRGGLVDINAVTSVTSTGSGTITTTSVAADGTSGAVDIDAGTSVNLLGAISAAGAATNGAGGNVSVDAAAGSITVASIAASGSGSGAGGNVQLTAVGQNSDVAVNGAVSTNGTGAVTMTAPDAVTFSAGGSISANGTGAVQVTANSDALAGNSGDGITMAGGSFISAGTGTTPSGSVTLQSTGPNGGPIVAQALSTVNATILVDSGTSVLLQGAVNSRGGLVDINAVTGVTSDFAGTITTTANVANGFSGAVDIDAGTGVTLVGGVATTGAAANGAGGNVDVSAAAGNISVQAIDASGSGAGSGGTIILVAGGQNSDVTLNDLVTTNGAGGIGVVADDAVTLTGTSGISAGGTGFAIVIANAATTDGDSGDGITMANGSFINAGTGTATSGPVFLYSTGLNGGPIQAQSLTARNATIQIQSGDSVSLQQAVHSHGGAVDIDAVTGVTGTASATITTTGDLPDANSGSVNIDAGSAVTLAAAIDASGFDNNVSSLNSNGGSVAIVAAGAITVDAITTDGGDVTGGGAGGNAGAITLNAGASTVTLNDDLSARGGAGSVTGNGGNIVILSPVVITQSTAITSNGGVVGGNIQVTGTMNGTSNEGQDLTLTAGTGDITVSGATGGTTPLRDLTIVSARNTTTGAIDANSVAQLAGTGTTFLGGAVTTTSAAGISIVTAVDVIVGGNLTAMDGGVDESISLSAGRHVSVLPGVTAISTRDIVSSTTGDQITVIADSDANGTGTVFLPLAAGFEFSTDSGIAKQFAPRPAAGVMNTAFFFFVSEPIVATLTNQEVGVDGYRSEWTVMIGITGEENLRIVIDWQDPTVDLTGLVHPDTGTGNPVNSDPTPPFQEFVAETGGLAEIFGHVYTSLDLVQFVNSGLPFFDVYFSVSHHDSISVLGAAINQNGANEPVPPPGLLSSTDLTSTVIPENGSFRVSVPTITLPVIQPDVVPPPPQPAPIPPAPVAPDLQVFVTVAQPVEYPYSSYTTQSEDYFQLRRVAADKMEVVEKFERIPDEFGELLLQPARLKQWVAREDFDGPGYELWLITTKRTKDGQTLKIERPVLKFDVADQQPFPAAELLPDEFPQLKLEPMPLGDDWQSTEPGADPDSSGPDGAPVNPGQNPGEQEQPGDATTGDRAALEGMPVEDPEPAGAVAEEFGTPVLNGAGLARSALVGLTVNSVLGSRRPSQVQSLQHARLMNRVLAGHNSKSN